jgi:AAA15 family ATPase/GTPase
MLTRFEVTNFKSFKDKFVFDFTNTSDYQFNPECVKDGVVNKGIIYGANGCGKSNLGLAIFDIVSHLTDNNNPSYFYNNYQNAESAEAVTEFTLFFRIYETTLEYSYIKVSNDFLLGEQLKIDNVEVVRHYSNAITTLNLKGAESLNRNLGDSKISALKYIKNNAVLEKNKTNDVLKEFFNFIDNMLFFRTLNSNDYIGCESGKHQIVQDILKNGHLTEFEDFLNKAGIACQLSTSEWNGHEEIVFLFGNKKIQFWDIASTGTGSLTGFYFWLQRLKERKVSFVFIDEFDAFYHHELSEFVVKELKKTNTQVILTTHNTSIMTNDLLRPDCYFLMNKEVIKPLSKCTDRELRFGHNLEKMYRAEAFDV